MNHYKALQIADSSGRWRYTRTRDHETLATGYCADDPATGTLCCGHETAEGACEHYKQYLLDNARYNIVKVSDGSNPGAICLECSTLTSSAAFVDGSYFLFCDDHRDREHLAKYLTVGETWSSY